MKLNIDRGDDSQAYEIQLRHPTLLQAFIEIRENIDPSLGFDYACKSGVCGACAVRVNGEELLACQYDARSGDSIEPLRNFDIIKDLIVDKNLSTELIKKAKISIDNHSSVTLDAGDETKTIEQSNCILCCSCYSACPALDEKEDFLGPFVLTRVLRYANDNRAEASKTMMDTIQKNGIWDCVLCSACTDVCPQYIDSKEDIVQLIKKSLSLGYVDPRA
ncbi:MAG: succinate dehydrogenase/fumarate reductase iron-sulfur subunit [Sulfurovum sp.]|nr:succinate dehydrogenase/fumarate reductase iron-sulfur subunit [Sulfurovum sp.]